MHDEALSSEPHVQPGQTHRGGAVQPQVLRTDIVSTPDFVIGTVIALVMAAIGVALLYWPDSDQSVSH